MPNPSFQSVSIAREPLHELTFTHWYEPPHGRSSLAPMNLAEPLMYPMVEGPKEEMSLLQVLIRVAASEREPFRRALVLFPNPETLHVALDEALSWALAHATKGFGAELVPIVLSLQTLVAAGHEQELRALLKLSKEEGRTFDACHGLLTLAAACSGVDAVDLTELIVGGNAWVFIEDDRDSDVELKLVRETLTSVFRAKGALSHVPIIVMTADKEASVLDSCQRYRFSESPSAGASPGVPARPVTGWDAALCRWAAYWGRPPVATTLALAAILALPLVAVAATQYDGVRALVAGGDEVASLHLPVSANAVRVAVVASALAFGFIIPLIIGFALGLGWGSEVIRVGFVAGSGLTVLTGMSLLLLLVPGALPPTWRPIAAGMFALIPALLVSLMLLQWLSQWADIVWLLASSHVLRGLIQSDLATMPVGLAIELHVAEAGNTITLGRSGYRTRLPLLVCRQTGGIIAVALGAFPRLSLEMTRRIMLGLRKNAPRNASFCTSALMIEALAAGHAVICQRTLDRVADLLEEEWDPGSSPEYKLSLDVSMTALEYVGRRLCYRMRRPELVIVR